MDDVIFNIFIYEINCTFMDIMHVAPNKYFGVVTMYLHFP
jgi:hypothetical protein